MSKDAQPGSGHNSRQVSALSRSSGRKTYKESSNDLERPSSSNLRSNQFLPDDIHGEVGGMEQFDDSEQRDEEDDILDVHPEDDDLYEDDE